MTFDVRVTMIVAVMQALYESEINVSVSSFWDGGWNVKLGDPLNGFKAEGNFDFLDDTAANWLIDAAKLHYRNSVFAKTWDGQ